MSQNYTIFYGPWAPDLSNNPVPMTQYAAITPTTVPCADCLNVYYADGSYQSLPSPVALASISAGLPSGAFTAIDASGTPIPIVGTNTVGSTNTGEVFIYQNGNWVPVSAAIYNSASWAFAQFGQAVYAVDGSPTAQDGLQVLALDGTSMTPAGIVSFTGSITSNVLTVISFTSGSPLQVGMVLSAPGIVLGTTILSLGTGTGGTGTYNLSTTPNLSTQAMFANIPPVGNVVATSGQFLVLGDIGFQFTNNAQGTNGYALGTGDGTTRVFTGIIPNVPLRKQSVILSVGAPTNQIVFDKGDGTFFGAGLGTINYATGAISVNFNAAPPNTQAVIVTYTQAFPERVWWSAIGLPAFFPAPLTNAALAFQSSQEDLQADLGPVMAIVGYPLYFLVFQRSGITRAVYQGGNVVFAFAPYEFKRGLVSRGAYCQVGPNTHFLSDQGFFSTDGANVTPTGTAPDNSAGIDNWFWANVNKAELGIITAGYDASTRSVMYAIPTGINNRCDTLLTYNIVAQRWTKSQVPTVLIWSDTDGTRHRLGLLGDPRTFGPWPYQLLTGTPKAGYLESCDLQFMDGNRRLTTGGRPIVSATDKPLLTIGTRDDLNESVKYADGSYPDRFSKLCPALSSGMFTRARLGSAAAKALTGVTLQMESEGPM